MRTARFIVFASLVVYAAIQPSLAAELARVKEKVLHSFGTGADGAKPFAGLTQMKAALYGTTIADGANGEGTLFALDAKTGAETVLYSFCSHANCTDGSQPYGGVVALNGELYGTTFEGGAASEGSVFAFDPATGQQTVLYSFCAQENCTDGYEPIAGLIAVKGKLYGTTFSGGAHGSGTVFAIDVKTGAETTLYSFCSKAGCADGESPESNLVELDGILYGTNVAGGADGQGVAFAIDPKSDAERTLHSFCSQQDCADGGLAEAGLTALNGVLYGAAATGGANDGGTAFSLDPNTGAETVLYSFCNQENCTDGATPFSSLLVVKGTLYGMTIDGGATGYGTVFSLAPSNGTESVLYSFCRKKHCTDGVGSDAALIDVKGTLYSTTFFGGANGQGTAFALKP
ncbi:MAG TPA: choice-of-anchor tandem repeat GloVer-containing protein [Rhizomicrobium sp.]|jgi:uncharacterized repeat protein (TIGR03803 family)